ncbi:hypothetical protein HPB50_021988 [Hyalomma asiaticum]|uniref:Uncharacterized protein n=1 Tax=Hyalomma asiaticum TaxID=266040 RepID=A0ACB7SAV8_HYAAI|nr:hypothetical protein HPB50_021988 [Hyalomma asiaticum]
MADLRSRRFAVLPVEDPVIRGLRNQYQIGDPVNLTCSYGPSKPNASLTWYINDRQIKCQGMKL